MKYITKNKFLIFLEKIFEKSKLQKKAIEKFLARQDSVFFERAEIFSEKMLRLIKEENLDIEFIIDSYQKMCNNMIIEQTKFKKKGEYSCKNEIEAYEKIYSSYEEMSSYMYGLALSIFLWPNHYKMYDFFIKKSLGLNNVLSFLEVGPGHGLYLIESIKIFPKADFQVIDISPISLEITKSIVSYFSGFRDCVYKEKSVYFLDDGKFDYIVMCEVLEHLDNPAFALQKIFNRLNENGKLFITTCANAPAIDHVYLYEDVDHIRNEINNAGFRIEDEIALPVGNYRESEWEQYQVEINYAALLSKKYDKS